MKINIELSTGKKIELAPNEYKELLRNLGGQDKEVVFYPWGNPAWYSQPVQPWSPWTYGVGTGTGPQRFETTTIGWSSN